LTSYIYALVFYSHNVMHKILQTPRLYLRQFEISDAQLLIDLNTNPNVIRYTGDQTVVTIQEAQRILLEIILPQYKNKMGRWAVHLKSNNEFIGWCGLKYIAQEDEIDLGYRYFENYWNKGYATEAAQAVMDYGKNILHLQRIVARAAVENKASISVIKKMGMRYIADELCAHDPAQKFEITF
jgi:[ribosomal protein S5]-alanine N-acetyltransferase